MLVLARAENERIRIGDDIEVIILSVRGKCVRVGINAPKSVRIDREEIHEKRKSDGQDNGNGTTGGNGSAQPE